MADLLPPLRTLRRAIVTAARAIGRDLPALGGLSMFGMIAGPITSWDSRTAGLFFAGCAFLALSEVLAETRVRDEERTRAEAERRWILERLIGDGDHESTITVVHTTRPAERDTVHG